MRTILTALVAALVLSSCMEEPSFYRTENGRILKDGRPQYFIGANLWYAAILASEGEGGDRDRLASELDMLKSMGVTNLRVLVGADGPDGTPYKVAPTLQKEPGVYDKDLLEGLDYLMVELGKRDMSAVLYLNNTWEWSGGYGMYLEWAGEGRSPLPIPDGWNAFRDAMAGFVVNDKAKELFSDHVAAIVSRVNTITGRPYKDDPAIFSWQIGNEPRAMSSSDTVKNAFAGWIWDVAAQIKSLDPNHMVSTGSEGYYGCEADMELFERIHSCPDIDYMNIHIWPYNWRWVDKDNMVDSLCVAIRNTDSYIDMHLPVAEKYGKPLIIEEFGYPRNGVGYSKSVSVSAKDGYYSHIFRRLIGSAESDGIIAGVNFWAWGGLAGQSEDKLWWKPGDEYCGDPAQEPQGFYSVYTADTTTVSVIRKAVEELESLDLPRS